MTTTARPETASTTPAAPEAPATAPQKPARDPWLDNAKMTLVLLVVVGHSWTLLPVTTLNDQLYDFLYAWHIPAFVLVTGFLSRSFTWSPQRLWSLVRTVAVPYVLFEGALALFRIYVGGEKLEDLFANPHWPMWFLSALFFWRLVTPVFKAMPPAVAVVASLVVSLAAGAWAGDTLDLARVCGLLPFFVLGLVLTKDRLDRLRDPRVQVFAVLALGSLLWLAHYTNDLASTEWLYYRAQYAQLTTSDLEAVTIRAVVLTIGLVGALSFLALVPRAGGWFTRMGAYTLVVYLFHGFVVLGAEFAGYPDWADLHPALSLVVTTGAAVGLALALASGPVASRLTELVDPLGWAERHAVHAVDLSMQAVVHEATVDHLEDAVTDAVDDGHGTPVTTAEIPVVDPDAQHGEAAR